MKKNHVIRDREAGNVIDEFTDYGSAHAELEKYEAADKRDGTYVPDFYEIVTI